MDEAERKMKPERIALIKALAAVVRSLRRNYRQGASAQSGAAENANRTRGTAILALAAWLVMLSGCATRPRQPVQAQVGESVVLIGEESASLGWSPLRQHPFRVRSTYLASEATVDYIAGRDFLVDFEKGSLRRTPGSRIPDFRTNMLFGKEEFDHSKFPGFGNGRFFAFVDYSFASSALWPLQTFQANLLKRTHGKLLRGEPVKIVAYGDSITAGGDASKPELIFWRRWVDELKSKYPASNVTAQNGATGGDSTVQGLQRLQVKVLDANPDLVLIGFGMNDHNKTGVPVPQFEENLKQMIARIRQHTKAEVILFSAFPPNPRWKYGSHHMEDYAMATERAARETSCAYANVFGNWEAIAERKKPEDLLGNNINHPNDFGHWIYYRVLTAIGL
jgi:acyl-CoA thioesterase-1